MNEDQLLLVLTICDLLDKSTSVKAVQRAYAKAEKQVERDRQRQSGKSPQDRA